MSKVCQVTGKRPVTGHNVSHANNKTKRRFVPNIQERRFWVPEENRFVTLKVSTAGMRTIDNVALKLSLMSFVHKARKFKRKYHGCYHS